MGINLYQFIRKIKKTIDYQLFFYYNLVNNKEDMK